MFARQLDSVQVSHGEMILDFAKASNADYVVVADEPSGDLEDLFIDVGGKRVLDTHVSHSYGHGIQSVWVDESRSAGPPDGVSLEGSVDIGNDFRKYLVTP